MTVPPCHPDLEHDLAKGDSVITRERPTSSTVAGVSCSAGTELILAVAGYCNGHLSRLLHACKSDGDSGIILRKHNSGLLGCGEV